MNSNLKIQAVLLDMDGTLVDTECFYKRVWQLTSYNLGFELTDDMYSRLIGLPLKCCVEMIQKYLPKHITAEIYLNKLMFNQNLLEEKKEVYFKDGAVELLNFLLSKKITTGIVTSSHKDTFNKNFSNTIYKKMFSCVVTCEDVDVHKPDPAPYLKACHLLNVISEKTLAIEDSNIGARSAIDAECKTIVVPDICKLNINVQKEALLICKNLYEVITYLQTIV